MTIALILAGLWLACGIAAHIFFRAFNPRDPLMDDIDWVMVVAAYIGGPMALIGYIAGEITVAHDRKRYHKRPKGTDE